MTTSDLSKRLPEARKGLTMHYSSDFYNRSNDCSSEAPQAVLSAVARMVSKLDSVIDVGAGTGAWLAAARDHGAAVIEAVEGAWIRDVRTSVPFEVYRLHDLRQDWEISRRFDLALSLEVAEHLPRSRAPTFVDLLCRLSDVVVFSAAVPGQGGHHHVNERWQDYWVQQFLRNGYEWSDALRNAIWNNSQIPVYYRQNILLFYRRERKGDLRLAPGSTPGPASVLHPEVASEWQPSIRSSLGILGRAIRRRWSPMRS